MTWLRALEIGLDIANVAINLENSERLNQLQRLGETAEFRQRTAELRKELTNKLRTEIFSYRQALDAALAAESLSVFRTSVALKVLEHRLNETKITSDDFEEFADKEFVHTVHKALRENAQRVFRSFDAEDQRNILEVVQALLKLPEYDYFLKTYTDYVRLQEADAVVRQLQKKNAPELLTGLMWFKMIAGTMLTLYAAATASIVAWIACISAWVGGYILQLRWQQPAAYKQAVETQKSLQPRINASLMRTIEAEVKHPEHAKVLRDHAQVIIRKAFGTDAPLLIG